MYTPGSSCRGVFERDFFRSRGPQEVREVFQRVGVEMPDQVFQEVWQEAERRDPRGEVCPTPITLPYQVYIHTQNRHAEWTL